jgi:signal transduction histidine kinase
VLFAIAAVGPWFGYRTITAGDHDEQIANAEHSLELLAAVYAEHAIPSTDRGAAPTSDASTWMRTLPQVGNVAFAIRPMKSAPDRTVAAGVNAAGSRPPRIHHDNGVLAAELDFPAAGVTSVASLRDVDILGGWKERTRFWSLVLLVRTMMLVGCGGLLVYQLRWRETVQSELIRTREVAESATRAKSEFLANMSHELRTPLNAIIGFSEIIKAGMFGPLNNRYREYGGHIFTSGRHLLELVNDLLDASKLESGRFELDESATDLASVIRAAMHLVQPMATKGKVNLVEVVADDLPFVHADARRLQQAILNPLANAVKFTPPGGEIRVSAFWLPRNILIQIKDNGIGMAPDQIPWAMQPFRQLKNRLRTRNDGTGLGLSIAKDLVELHGGSLNIDSKVNAGTTVTISLPAERILRDSPPQPASAPAPAPDSTGLALATRSA